MNNRLEKFLIDIRKQYRKAREPVLSNKKNKSHIKRGESRQISSIGEDLFAELIYDELKNKNLFIFVNQPITYGKRQPYKPDVVVCIKKNDAYEIKYMIDLKMDTGHIRKSFEKHALKLKKICKDLIKSKKLHAYDGLTKKELKFIISKKTSYDEVVVTAGNNSAHKEQLIRDSHNKKCNIWVLSIGNHPNSYKKEIDMKPNNDDWMLLINKIKGAI